MNGVSNSNDVTQEGGNIVGKVNMEIARLVVCAAIRDKLGRIITGARHFDDVMVAQIRRTGPDQDAFRTAEQGFIDQRGEFLTRAEAWKVAEAAGQIMRRVGGDGERLFSENLY